jgi:hypothetical protein
MSNNVHGTVWPDWQVDLVVADYFNMFADEIAGRPYNKAEHNRSLQALTGRTHASIEFKHCNISAVLEQLGIRGVRRYRPNFVEKPSAYELRSPLSQRLSLNPTSYRASLILIGHPYAVGCEAGFADCRVPASKHKSNFPCPTAPDMR